MVLLSDKSLTIIRNAATAAAIVVLGVLLLGAPAFQSLRANGPSIGAPLVRGADSLVDVLGTSRPAVSRDSLTLLVFIDPTCRACRINSRAYVELSSWAALQSTASRFILLA